MLVEFDFAVTQTAYVNAAMDEIPAFRPDGETPAQVQARVDSATPVRLAYVAAKDAIDGARALRRASIETLHDGCVDFAAQGRSRFRKNPALMERFARLPKEDQTFQETMTRAGACAAFWATLPLVGTPPAAFAVGQGTGSLSLAGFEALMAAAGSADTAIPAVDQEFQAAEGDLHVKQAELEDFVTAALEQGRSQFEEGTAEREIIDAIPTAPDGSGGGGGPVPPTIPLPTAPQNGSVGSGNPGSGDVNFDWQPAPAEQEVTDYHIYRDGVLIATVQAPPATIGGFTSGEAVTLTVRGVNAAGEGPDSEPVTGTAG